MLFLFYIGALAVIPILTSWAMYGNYPSTIVTMLNYPIIVRHFCLGTKICCKKSLWFPIQQIVLICYLPSYLELCHYVDGCLMLPVVAKRSHRKT